MHRAAAPMFAAALSLLATTAGAQVYDGYPAPSSQATPYRTVPYDEAPSQAPPYDAPSSDDPYRDAPPGDGYYGAQEYPPDAQYGSDSGYGYGDDGNAYPPDGGAAAPVYDYARVLRVDPVYAPSRAASGTRCYSRDDTYARSGGYGDDGQPRTRPQPSQGGRTAATIVGGVVGALVGSRFGGGSARYATSALGTMAGGMVGQRVYDQSHAGNGSVTICDPVPDGRVVDDPYGSGGAGVQAYDVTYEYAGRQYVTRTGYNPGSRIRVRVDVQPQ